MAFDETLAEDVRVLLAPEAGETDVTEKRMFGGLAFLLGGNMAVVVRGQGGVMVRLNPEDHEALLSEPGTEPMLMRGREMRGWITLPPTTCADPAVLEAWVTRAVAYTKTLPRK